MPDHEAGDVSTSPASGMPGGVPAGAALPDDTRYDAVATAILGGGPRYTRTEVAELTGIPLTRLTSLWRALGFPSVADDAALFTDSDISALRELPALLDPVGVTEGDDLAIVRTLGRTFNRLAEWEVRMIAKGLADVPAEELGPSVEALLPTIQRLHDYAWRRHLAGAAARVLLSGTTDGAELAVGFVDMVGFTRTSRRLSGAELGDLVERFEASASALVAAHHGRVIKTIGDEILFVTDTPEAAIEVALTLAALHDADPDYPQVRGGVAHGPVLARLGDVFGETVNIASRLTSLARPGTVLANGALAEALGPAFAVRRLPAERVRGYSRLEAWAVRRAPDQGTRATP